MKVFRSSLILAMMILVVTSTLGYAGGDAPPKGAEDLVKKSPTDWEHRAGNALDEMAKLLEEYGTITMSSPLLLPPNDDFAFNLRRGATNYYNDAKANVEGNAASFIQSVNQFSLGLSAQADPTQLGSYLDQLRQYQDDRTLYQASRQRANERRTLQDEAARIQFDAAKESAMTETDPVKRAQRLADAYRAYSTNLSDLGVANPPAYPTPPDESKLPAKPSGVAKTAEDARKLLAGEGKLRDFMGLIPSNAAAPQVSDRAALVTAAGDVAVEAIFRALGSPAEAAKFQGKKLLFGVVEVAVNPGWRTKKDFAANVALRCGFKNVQARPETVQHFVTNTSLPTDLRLRLAKDNRLENSLPADLKDLVWKNQEQPPSWDKALTDNSPLPTALLAKSDEQIEHFAPLVSGISPMMESEVLDLESSSRRETELALSLSAALRYAGLKGEAEGFEKFVKSHQLDVRTRSGAGIVNTWSAGGGLFGFEVGPRLKALKNPASDKSGAGNVLDRQSFPALIILGFDIDEVRPALRWTYHREATFAKEDLKNASALAAKLNDSADPVSTYLKGRLANSTRKLLEDLPHSGDVELRLQEALVGELNRIVTGASIWDETRFSSVQIRSGTQNLTKCWPPLKGEELARLNRFLLEDAYQVELSRMQGLQLELVEVALVMQQSPRWVPLDPGFFSHPRISETEKFSLLADLKNCLASNPNTFAKHRAEVLTSQLCGSGNSQMLPLDWFVAAPPPCPVPLLPQVSEVVPSEIRLSAEPAEPNSTFRLYLIGAKLDAVDLGKTELVASPALLDSAKLSPAKLVGGTLLLDLSFANTKAITKPVSFSLRLGLDPDKTHLGTVAKPAYVQTPPVQILPPAAAPAAANQQIVLKSTLLDKADTNRVVESTLTFPKDASPELIQAFGALLLSDKIAAGQADKVTKPKK